ncbi:MAG: hypothetical protein HY753_03015 [Nitrospirae bacterium]|nr:hypothetical protein [Nitrospirota bacterium]
MTRDEVLKKIEEARAAIKEYKKAGLDKSIYGSDQVKIKQIQNASKELIVEAKTIGAAGDVCPRCGGSGRV